jgi:hypothetical protein
MERIEGYGNPIIPPYYVHEEERSLRELCKKIVCKGIGRYRERSDEDSQQHRALADTEMAFRCSKGKTEYANKHGIKVESPHLHAYREGFGDSWAIPLPENFPITEGIRLMTDGAL